ncbi:hypothetical protein RhiirA5_396426 [Rhizophagus irregularis]|uniref:RNA exonuclease 4 n=4 Tax=Rhizophagus irregularis TaxID=588596 RepID=A0A2I1EUE2_9GLOM|nr:ribonuclease H-like domain-containing protein [Rhizophagus irregularis DAOM 181602=DAOM 197198]EXX71738.1 Rex4p [Rhizophagus irregularis DAOM 197198w]PKC13134.1 hypothetical protein RhiirA5_396426 [Rhizophagus irregularis]PKY25738.1 hypothetical protein RhiirB3_472663 [Rhizophagus irregularis]POG74806.1 ribonuclease H-like domain-containing protein [Rhizophagus irregularis DAOM 181602=DAOM 197198]CAB5393828.1 unnamed protein product [Rhizophagus irregularis]|eukprot:XP_025181672.1 ribonuclease H-like domain-containing protein [Rhizophagus irregularis DAOM 181602=DAOM 197198]
MSEYRLSQPRQSTDALFNYLNEKLMNNPDKLSVNERCVAIDCEMVGVGYGGKASALARVSIVNYYGIKLMDKYVKPKRVITDYRTLYSGITPKHLENAYDFEEVKREVQELLEGNLIVGQSLGYDFCALELERPDTMIRDTSCYYYLFGDKFGRRPLKKPSLKVLTREVLGLDIQQWTHDSIEDARACMLLYRLKQDEWETAIARGQKMPLDIGGCYVCGSLGHTKTYCPWRRL